MHKSFVLASSAVLAAVTFAPRASAQGAPQGGGVAPATSSSAQVQGAAGGTVGATGTATGASTGAAAGMSTTAPAATATGTAGAPPPVVTVTPAPASGTTTTTVTAQQRYDQTAAGGTPIDLGAAAGARAVGAPPPGTSYSDFMDTRLTWTFGDDDFLHKTGELVPLSPNFSIGDRKQYQLFFDGLNSRFAGRENLTHLALYKKMPGFIPNLDTEAAIVLTFDLAQLSSNTNNLNQAIYDAGSYIRVFYHPGGNEKTGFSATFFPLDTDRFRLGYLYDISWGGTAAYINQSIFPRIQGSAPGLKLQWDAERGYAFLGFKTAQIVQPQQVLNPGGENDVETVRVAETNYGFLGGFGVDPAKFLRFDVGAGFFQQGKFDLEDVRGQQAYTYGAAGRIVVHHDMPVPSSVDFRLYRNDPMAPQILFAPEVYKPGQVAWSLSAEGDFLRQNLKDFDTAGVTKLQNAYAGALQGVLKAGYARVSVTGIYRNLNFVVRNVPGFIPFETLPANAKSDPELFGALALDYYIQAAHLTPGLGGGVQLPSTFKSEFTDGGIPASRTIVVRQQGDESILPYDKDRSAIFQGRVSLRWDLSTMLNALLWVQYVRDNNGTLVVRDPVEGTASLRVFQSPDRLGVGASMQARF